jgi:hypothetical protein
MGESIKGGSNMTGTNCDLFTHSQSQSYLNHLVFVYSQFVRKLWGRRPLGISRLRWEDIKMDFISVMMGHGLIGSGQGKVAVSCKCGDEPSLSIKYDEMFSVIIISTSGPYNRIRFGKSGDLISL